MPRPAPTAPERTENELTVTRLVPSQMIKLLFEYGADMDARNPKDWTALSYAKAAGKYGLAYEKGIYPEDVLLYYGAKEYGTGPPCLGERSPRNSYNPEAPDFSRERGSYQNPPEHP